MAPRRKPQPERQPVPDPAIFDRAHLLRYTMESRDLEREILELFMAQIPATVAMFAAAEDAAAWKFATHTLKGSAAAVGAWRIHGIASELETLQFDLNADVRTKSLERLEAAFREFRHVVVHLY